jgi:hypothetical protein
MTISTLNTAQNLQAEIEKINKSLELLSELKESNTGSAGIYDADSEIDITHLSNEEKNFICTYLITKRLEELKQLQEEFESL